MSLPGPLLDYRQGYARGFRRAERLARGAASVRACLAVLAFASLGETWRRAEYAYLSRRPFP